MNTIYLLCGLLCDETVWETQIKALGNEGYDVQAISFQAFDSINDMAAHLLKQAPARFSLAGHSMGGRVALEAYRQAPQRITRLALLDTGFKTATAEETEKREWLLRKAESEGIDAIAESWARMMIAPSRHRDSDLLNPILSMVGRMSDKILSHQTRAMLSRPDAAKLLTRIRCPTQILCGKQDSWSPPEHHQKMASFIAGSELSLIDDCGHMSTMEQPEEVLSILRRWMQKADHPTKKTLS